MIQHVLMSTLCHFYSYETLRILVDGPKVMKEVTKTMMKLYTGPLLRPHKMKDNTLG